MLPQGRTHSRVRHHVASTQIKIRYWKGPRGRRILWGHASIVDARSLAGEVPQGVSSFRLSEMDVFGQSQIGERARR